MEKVELVVDGRAEVGEGPLWHADALWWLDIPAGEVHRHDPSSGADETYELGQPVGALVAREGGGFMVAARDGFGGWDGPGSPLDIVAPVELEEAEHRMNDGKVDREGRFWASTMELTGAAGEGALYRLDPDLTVTRHLGELSIGNGLAWSADDALLYFIDSLSGGIDVMDYDLAEGTVAERRRLITVEDGQGLPDGMAIDAQGCLWVAFFGGGCVRRYTPEGALDRVLELPVTNVTACAFGGAELDTLYITTARHGLDEDQRRAEPHAGGVFAAQPGVTGVATTAFGG